VLLELAAFIDDEKERNDQTRHIQDERCVEQRHCVVGVPSRNGDRIGKCGENLNDSDRKEQQSKP